jgi:hypothetical protein
MILIRANRSIRQETDAMSNVVEIPGGDQRKDTNMTRNFESKFETKHVEQLMAEADELIRQFNIYAAEELEEEHRLQLERHAQNLLKIKSEAQERIAKTETKTIGPNAEGIHEALHDIAKAMGELKQYLSGFPFNAFK